MIQRIAVNDKMVIKCLVKEDDYEKTKGGLMVKSGGTADPYMRAEVISAGNECKVVKAGDVIALSFHSGSEGWNEMIDGKSTFFKVVRESDAYFIEKITLVQCTAL